MPKETTALLPAIWSRFSDQYFLATGLRVAIVDGNGGMVAAAHPDPFLCCMQFGDRRKCSAFYRKAAQQSLQGDEPLLFRCPGGLLAFGFRVVPEERRGEAFVVLGGVAVSDGPAPSRLSTLIEGMGGDRQEALRFALSIPDIPPKRLVEMARLAEFWLRTAGRGEELKASFSRRRAQITTLFEVASDFHQTPSDHELHSLALNTLGVLFDVPAAAILLQEPGEEMLKTRTAMGELEGPLLSWQMPVGFEALNRLWEPGADPLALEGELNLRRLHAPEGVERAVLFPLAGGGGRAGLLAILNTSVPAEDAQLIRGFSVQLSLALENRRLRMGMQDKVGELKGVKALGLQFLLCREPDRLFETILEQARRITGARHGSLMIAEGSTGELLVKAVRGINVRIVQKLRTRAGEGVAGRVFESGEPIVVQNVERDPRFHRKNRARHGTKSFVSMPISVDDRTIGVLNLSDKLSGETFAEDDVRLLEALAVQATLAIERSSYYQQSLELRQISITDALTGLLNRRYFQERLAEEVERATRHGHDLSLIMIDIDHFKAYNDANGHPAGDKALVLVGRALRGSVRAIDVVSRFGGEEFAVILPETRKQEACEIGERIRNEVASLYFPGEEDLPMKRLTISLGVAGFPEDAQDLTSLIHRSDKALYAAKDQGRNRLVSYGDSGRGGRAQGVEGGALLLSSDP